MFDYIVRNRFEKYTDIVEEIDCKIVPNKEYVISLFLLYDKYLFNYSDCNLIKEFSSYISTNKSVTKTKSTTTCTTKVVIEETAHWVKVSSGGSSETYHNYDSYDIIISRHCVSSGEEIQWPLGGGGGGLPAPLPLPVPAPEVPIESIVDYLDCIDSSLPLTLTIYVDQPIANSTLLVSASGDVGHTFVGLTQGDNTSIFGFYPEDSGKAGIQSSSILGDNSNTSFDVSISIEISSSQLKLIMDHTINSGNTNYDLENYNCTDFAIEIAFLAGLHLQDTHNSYTSNPALLGQFIRNMNISDHVSRNRSGGKSPFNNKTCTN